MKAKLIQIFYTKYYHVSVWWWSLCLFLSKALHKDTVVKRFASSQQLGTYIEENFNYKKDPWSGKLNFARHPGVFQYAMNHGRHAGDCLDTALYRCYATLYSGIITQEMHICVYAYKEGRSTKAHAIMVWKENDLYYMADYGAPIIVGYRSPWDFKDIVYTKDGMIAAVMIPVLGRSKKGHLEFGKPEGVAYNDF